jgi:hypothetical protein
MMAEGRTECVSLDDAVQAADLLDDLGMVILYGLGLAGLRTAGLFASATADFSRGLPYGCSVDDAVVVPPLDVLVHWQGITTNIF